FSNSLFEFRRENYGSVYSKEVQEPAEEEEEGSEEEIMVRIGKKLRGMIRRHTSSCSKGPSRL
ncbi:hypothetical protein BGX29_011976, partial [Mortierella sp. GBA35]